MALTAGQYLVKAVKDVIYWPKADANGDGEPLWETKYDPAGNVIGRELQRDQNGNEVRNYQPPNGFRNVPSSDHTDNYVLCDERGFVKRLRDGSAVNIKPGQALVFEADGTVTVLADEYAQYLFQNAHDAVEKVEPEKVDA